MPPASGARLLSLFVAAFLLLFPCVGPEVARNVVHDIDRLGSTECEYRGIRSNFADLSTAYALTVFDGAELLRWSAEVSARYPEIEPVVTGTYSVSGIKPSAAPAALEHRDVRIASVPTLSVSWTVNTLGMLMITASNPQAEDALNVFRHTIDGFLDRMVVVHKPTTLRLGPSAEHDPLEALDHGTVLLVEEEEGGWSRVRLPSTTTSGWCETTYLVPVGNE